MSRLRIRRAVQGDIGGVSPLFDAYRQFYARPPDPELAERFIRERIERNESVILVAEREGGELVGFCQLYPTFCSVSAASTYVLYDLFVTPPARRSGAGRALLQAAQAQAQRDGMVRLELSTAKTNAPAQALYESLSWVRDEEFFTYSLDIPAGGFR